MRPRIIADKRSKWSIFDEVIINAFITRIRNFKFVFIEKGVFSYYLFCSFNMLLLEKQKIDSGYFLFETEQKANGEKNVKK